MSDNNEDQQVDYGISDEMHQHFTMFGRWNWCEIADEGRRVLNERFGGEVEQDSPTDIVLSAVAAQAWEGAFAAVAAMLGIEHVMALQLVAYAWYDHKDNLPPPISIEELRRRVAEQAAHYTSQK
jgi:hypothetical protein